MKHVKALALFLSALSGVAEASTGSGSFDALVAQAKASMLASPRKSIISARAAERISLNTSDARERIVGSATARWLIGEAYLRIDEVDHAEPLIRRALADIEKLEPDSRLYGDLLLSLGGISTERGHVAAALSQYQKAHRVYRQIHERRSEAKALIQIASLYYLANDWQNALKYHAEALDAFNTDRGLTFSIHNGRGNALKELGRYTEAQIEFDKAMKLAQQIQSRLLAATVDNNIARMALDAGDVGKADRAIADSVRKTGADVPPEFRKQQWALAAQAAYQHGEYQRAADLVDRIFAHADLAATTLADRDAHRTAYLTYRTLHRDDLALAHLQALKRLDDDATTLARSTNAALMGARFDFANQALKIANLKAEDAQKSAVFERQRARTQRWMFLGTAGATMIVIALLLFALRTSRRSRERVQAANDDLATTNRALGKALAAKTEFLATTSHEIRTPLNGILGMTQVMLVDRTLDDAARERLAVVHDAGTTMKALVDDILDVAKMESGKLTIESHPFDLRQLVETACAIWSAQARDKQLDFVCDLAGCPRRVIGDAARVRQILYNLLANAVKFTAAGRIELSVGRGGYGRCRLSIADSGIGIAPDKIDTIFESFRQADTSTTRRFGGTGLGLSISRNLARAMGGDVSVTSVPGEGATFTIDLSLPEATASCHPDRADDAVAIDLLIVERNPIARAMLKTLLAPDHPRIGFAVRVADALELAKRRSVGMILVDAGSVATATMGEDLAALAATRASVVLLAPTDTDQPIAAASIGLRALIGKPVTGNALVQRLAEIRAEDVDRVLVSRAA